ncbi:cupin domain-containing protein [Cohaesibacter celericrescens]|uniref:Cupin domain-containing protein n=1 Tax=Cohaesibacter celericrescens TaxID=2067669 RepID=A0A2N5XLT3_9HYPH|nr:cupin domain-containing protein [Cohaesibacter celericrescens]PLW75397.1 cupin domain-containing protein [Cohaesibacter celericrescens]
MFAYNKDTKLDDLGDGISRKIMAYSKNGMVVEVRFEEGAVAPLHSHPHEQFTYVISGAFEFTIGDETKLVSAGDAMYKEPNIIHGCKCVKAGMLLDSFVPMREDFVES